MNRLSSGVSRFLVWSALGLGVTGCGGDDDSSPAQTQTQKDIEVKGTWTNADFGETDVIDDTSWSTQYGDSDPTASTIVEYSNDDRSAVLLAPDDAAFNPSTYSAIVWTAVDSGSFYYCAASFGCASAEQAKNGPSDDTCTVSDVDDTDLDGQGCGGFAWTELSAP